MREGREISRREDEGAEELKDKSALDCKPPRTTSVGFSQYSSKNRAKNTLVGFPTRDIRAKMRSCICKVILRAAAQRATSCLCAAVWLPCHWGCSNGFRRKEVVAPYCTLLHFAFLSITGAQLSLSKTGRGAGGCDGFFGACLPRRGEINAKTQGRKDAKGTCTKKHLPQNPCALAPWRLCVENPFSRYFSKNRAEKPLVGFLFSFPCAMLRVCQRIYLNM